MNKMGSKEDGLTSALAIYENDLLSGFQPPWFQAIKWLSRKDKFYLDR